MNLDFNEKTKKIIATTLSILGIILIVIGFSIPNNNSISSNKPYQYAGNKDLEKSKKDKDSEIIVDNTEEKVDTSDEEKEENIIDEYSKFRK